MKFQFSFCNFSLLNNEITLKKTGLKIEITGSVGNIIKLIFGVGYTPKTYYSGHKPIVTMWAEMPTKYSLKEISFGGGVSNSEAYIETIGSNCLITLPPYGGGVIGFKLFADYVSENDFCKIFRYGTEPVDEKFKISNVGKATFEEYIQVLSGLELKSWKEKIKFSGWKRPVNLLENKTHKLGFVKLEGTGLSLPFAYNVETEEHDALLQATEIVAKYLQELYPEDIMG